MVKQTLFLVIRADRTFRVAKKPRLSSDEIALPIDLYFPDHWGKTMEQRITVHLPDFAPEVFFEDPEPLESEQ